MKQAAYWGTPLSRMGLWGLATGIPGGLFTYLQTGKPDPEDEDAEPMSQKERLRRALLGMGLWGAVGVGAGLTGGIMRHRTTVPPGGKAEAPFWKSLTTTDQQMEAASPTMRHNLHKAGGFIETDAFNRVLFRDAQTGVLQPDNAFALAGTLDATSQRNRSGFVTPGQVTKTLVNAGIGWATGAVIGKTLGAVCGLSSETQQTLRNTGMWSGVLNTLGNNIR